MMAFKRKHIVIVALTLCGMAILAWAIGSYLSNRAKQEQYQQALAQQFDKVYDIAYPLIENYALTLNDRVDSMEVMCKKAMEADSNHYNHVFYDFWLKYTRSERGRKVFMVSEEYEYFRNSPVFTLLMNGGDKRKKEIDAIQKLTWAGRLLLDPVLLRHDSLMNATKQARQFTSDALKVLEPYHCENTNIHAWRDIR